MNPAAGWQPNIYLKSYNLIFLHRVELSFSFDFPSFLTQSFDLQGIEPADPETFFKNSTEVAKK